MFPKDIANIIAQYAVAMRLRPWVVISEPAFTALYSNPNAIGAIITDHGEFVPIELEIQIPDDPDEDYMFYLLKNPSEFVGSWVRKNMHLIRFDEHHEYLLQNPGSWAGNIINSWISKYGDHWLDFEFLSENPGPWAVELLKKNPDYIWDDAICANSSQFANLVAIRLF
jgi:hypothetical protein